MSKSFTNKTIGELDPEVLNSLLEKYSKESEIKKWDVGASSSREISFQVQSNFVSLFASVPYVCRAERGSQGLRYYQILEQEYTQNTLNSLLSIGPIKKILNLSLDNLGNK